MKRSIIVIYVLLAWITQALATQQQPDILLIGNDTLYIDIGWGHPSPIEIYYEQNKIKYPFKMLHTANYRGHVATWKIESNKFYLVKIDVNSKSFKPEDLIQSKNSNERNLMDWFTGFILARKFKTNRGYDIEYEEYYYLNKGKVTRRSKFSETDYEHIRKEHASGKTINEISQADILVDYEKYVAYYFRQGEDEEILIDNQIGYIIRPNGGKLVMQYYDDVHLNWPYNWESKDITGVPIGNWKVINNQVYLTEINIHTGLDFYETEIYPVDINELFGNKDTNIKAYWLDGIYVVQNRKEIEKTDDYQIQEYEIESIRLIQIEKGLLVNQCRLDAKFDFENIDENTPQKTKELINRYLDIIE